MTENAMKYGYLHDYFEGVAAKRLSVVETDTSRSHQHEFQAVRAMLQFIGSATEPTPFPARFLFLADESEPIVVDASLTLYDSRRKNPLRSAEHRFYFADNTVTQAMRAGDLLIIAKERGGRLLVIIAQHDSSFASQMEWLFGIGLESGGERTTPANTSFAVRADLTSTHDRIAYASRFILETIGVEVGVADDEFLDRILDRFGPGWPDTREFSPFARELTRDVDVLEDPDGALIAWVDQEYVLYRTLEKHLISERLERGFTGETGVDQFLSYSLSVQNRRKSRSGSSLENHIEYVLSAHSSRFSRGARTEAHSRPDFLFPGAVQYADLTFPNAKLHMLASKRSAKDRWRQILAEAERIETKHLLTLEPSISQQQTDEMSRQNVRLVLPRPLHESFTSIQRVQLMTVREFIEMVKASLR
jgi:hypothetical protein